MTMTTSQTLTRRWLPHVGTAHLLLGAALLGSTACSGNSGSSSSTSSTPPAAAPASTLAGPLTIDLVRVVQQPLDVQVSLPGELAPYQTVAIHPRVNGFVKSVAVDRGSRVRAGEVLVTLEAPELVAQRAEAQSKLQAAESQLASARAKADGDRGTFDKLKAAFGDRLITSGQ